MTLREKISKITINLGIATEKVKKNYFAYLINQAEDLLEKDFQRGYKCFREAEGLGIDMDLSTLIRIGDLRIKYSKNL
ncbi:MAG: hypothetical protein ABIH59_02120 [archaeon]